MVITIDGPAGAGKSTVSRLLAKSLGFHYLDTGAMYRAVAMFALREGLLQDSDQLAERLPKLQLAIDRGQVWLDGIEIKDTELRTAEVTAASTLVAAKSFVRNWLVEMQKQIGNSGNFVTEGRDQGTDVFPEAVCKFFLTADPRERAKRRLEEMGAAGFNPMPSMDEMVASIVDRDTRDSSREKGALRAASDAIVVDTTALTKNAVVEKLEREARSRIDGVGVQ